MEENNEEVEVLDEEQKTNEVNEEEDKTVSEIGQEMNVVPEVNTDEDKTVAEIGQGMNVVPEVNEKIEGIQEKHPIKEENKEVNNDSKKSSKKGYILAIILFILLIVVILFLPDINKFISPMFNKENKNVYEESSSGVLRCTLRQKKKDISYEYLGEFEYDNNKLAILNYTTSVDGNKDELSPMKEKCDKLNDSVKNMSGVSITCSLSDNAFTQNQILTYSSLNKEKVKKAYEEANTNYPNFNDSDEIEDIQKKLESSGYECKKESK